MDILPIDLQSISGIFRMKQSIAICPVILNSVKWCQAKSRV